ncbi:hypothetical protein Tco_0921012, partial [Tanacetum coccineum]
MSTQQDIYAAGSENRPPMLNKENLFMVPHVFFVAEIKTNEADDQAIQTILLGSPVDSMLAVDVWKTAQENLEVDDLRAERLAKTHDPLALMANSNNPFNYSVFQQDQPSLVTYMQQPPPNNNYNPQPSFNQNYMQQPMINPDNIFDPTTTMNMALADCSTGYEYGSRQTKMQMVGGNGRNQFRQYAGQNVGNQNGYNIVQNVRNQ